MELSLLKTLMNKEFYEDHKGAKCPDRLFSKDLRIIKKILLNMKNNVCHFFFIESKTYDSYDAQINRN